MKAVPISLLHLCRPFATLPLPALHPLCLLVRYPPHAHAFVTSCLTVYLSLLSSSYSFQYSFVQLPFRESSYSLRQYYFTLYLMRHLFVDLAQKNLVALVGNLPYECSFFGVVKVVL